MPQDLRIYARRQTLDAVAITDHDTVDGLPDFCQIKDLLVVPGVEVTTTQGHVLALNVKTLVKAGQSFPETIDQIHEAGGLAAIAHPTGFFKSVPEERLSPDFDAIEVVNASAIPFSYSIRRNRRIAAKFHLPQIGGSDAHYGPEVGLAYTMVDADMYVDSIVQAIRNGLARPCGTAIPWRMRVKRGMLRVKRTVWGT